MAKVEIIAEFKDKVTAGLQKVQGQLENLQRTTNTIKFASLVSAASVAVNAVSSVASALAGVVRKAIDAELASLKFTSTLQQLTTATPEQIKQLEALASAVAHTTVQTKDAVLAQMSYLATVGVAPALYEKVIATAQAMSVALGVEMQTALEMTAKALQGHTTALQRHGIQLGLTKQEMQDASKVLDALYERFSPAQQAYLQSTASQLERLRIFFEELQESVGNVITSVLPLQEVIEFLRASLTAITPILTLTKNILQPIILIATQLLQILSKTTPIISGVTTALSVLINSTLRPLLAILQKIVEFVVSKVATATVFILKTLKSFITKLPKGKEIWEKLFGGVEQAAKPAVDTLSTIETKIANIRSEATQLAAIKMPSWLQVKTELAYINAEMRLYNEGIRRAKEEANDLSRVIRNIEINTETLLDSVRTLAERYANIADAISSRMTSAIFSIIEGTRTWKQVLTDVAKEIAAMIVKMLIMAGIMKLIEGITGIPVSALTGGVRLAPATYTQPIVTQPQLVVQIHNATPATYVTIFRSLSMRERKEIAALLRA